MPKVKSISFTDEYDKELAYLEKKGNKSRYVCELIRADMKNPTEDLENRIMEILKKRNLILNVEGGEVENIEGSIGNLIGDLYEDLD